LIRLDRSILHPFLFGAFFVLALTASNIREVQLILTERSLLLSLALPGFLLLLFRLLLRDWRKAALAATGLTCLFFVYGRVYAATETAQMVGIRLGGHRILISLWLALAAAWLWMSARRLDLDTWTRGMNVFGLAMVAVPTLQILFFAARGQAKAVSSAAPTVENVPTHLQVPSGQTPPDIYYIILDMYTRADALQQVMGYDNQPFLNALRTKGFYVADCSLSNYVYTYKSLTSSLNMVHLDELNPAFAPPNQEVTDLYPYLQDNRVRRSLQDAGYTFVAFETAYSPLNFKDADVYYPFSDNPLRLLTSPGLNPFESVLMQTSAGAILFDAVAYFPQLRPFLDYPYAEYRNRMLYAMDKMHQAVHIPGPKFVFMHLMAPHNPFVFGPSGEQVVRRTPFSQNADAEYNAPDKYIKGYTDEITYLNKRMDEITTYILANSQTPPVIIIQGDHGVPRSAGGLFDPWHNANLNAYYLPGDGSRALYETITPINSFRLVFNQYFNANLPLEDDTACFSSGNGNPFGCQVVTDPNPACEAQKR